MNFTTAWDIYVLNSTLAVATVERPPLYNDRTDLHWSL